MSAGAFYAAFLSILEVHGYVAVPSGDLIKILPDAERPPGAGHRPAGRLRPTSDEIVTQVIQVRNISAAQLVPILRPLIPQYGHLAAYPSSNMLIISDRAANVNRMLRIIQRIDQSGDADIDVIRLEHASSATSCASSRPCSRPRPAAKPASRSGWWRTTAPTAC
jgi:general secretion pathway protein D